MNIYAIKDLLINYYMQPFAAHNDNAVKAGMASQINTGDPNSDLAQAPHQYQIWYLGKVTEEGDLVANKNLVCDCSSLVRPGIRGNQTNNTTGGQIQGAAADRSGTTQAPAGTARPNRHAAQNPSPATHSERKETHEQSGGGNR